MCNKMAQTALPRSIVSLFYVCNFLERAWWIVLICLSLFNLPFVCFVQSLDNNTITEAIEDTIVGIYVVKQHAASEEVEDIGIVLEGIKVLQDLHNVALAVSMLFGLMYVLNLNYPAELRYTFEVIQKIWLELDGSKLSNKALALKNRLSQWIVQTWLHLCLFLCDITFFCKSSLRLTVMVIYLFIYFLFFIFSYLPNSVCGIHLVFWVTGFPSLLS